MQGSETTTPVGFFAFADVQPERLALIEPGIRETTYGELRDRVHQLSHGLRQLGLVTGDVVALITRNSRTYFELMLATGQIGLYLTPINYHLAASEIAYIVTNSEAKAVIVDPQVLPTSASALNEINFPADRRFVVGEVEGWRRYEALLEHQPTTAPADRVAGSIMLYTSGTTGFPKGVRRPLTGGSPEEALQFVTAFFRSFGFQPGDVHLVVSPLYHAAPGGFALNTLHLGHTVVIMDKFDPETALQLIERYRVNNTHMVPTMFYRLLQLPEEVRLAADISSLRSIVHAGAPCPVEVKSRMIDWLGPRVYEYYGASEGSASKISPQEWLEHPGSVGRALPGVTVKIISEEGQELPPGEVGLVYFGAPGNDQFEYYKDPAKTAATRRGNLITVGDLGYLDEGGWLYLSDRRTDMILSGGVNIYPAEIEARLMEHGTIADAAVIGIPDPEWGQRVIAFVQPRAHITPSEALAQKLIAWCRAGIASYKIPRAIEFRSELPRSAAGKMQRRILRDEYTQNAGAPGKN
jgi:long-chain acyl-CoA synthetase